MGLLRRLSWLLSIGFLPTALLHAAEIQRLQTQQQDGLTRTIVHLDGAPEYKVFTLANPDRVVIDIRNGRLAGGFNSSPAGLVENVRHGRQGSDLRIVLDLAATAQARSFVLSPSQRDGHRLVVELEQQGTASEPGPVLTVANAAPSGERDIIIAIDAGHGGKDPGAIGPTGAREKDITLQVARELKAVIDAERGLSAILIRDSDVYLPHAERYQKARREEADLFVSIHADAFTRPDARGSSVFVMSTRGASSEAARWLAERENAAELVGGVSLSDKDNMLATVLLDLSQGATLEASNAVAENVIRAMASVGNVHKNEVQRANFMVLRSPDVPSLLIETGFISNPVEERNLKDAQFRRRLALAIRDGIKDYFSVAPPHGTWYAANVKPVERHHTVSRGETLAVIARRHGVSVQSIRSANGLASDRILVGAVLRIPVSS
ncbi:N-acetylmuramoyl-L-alanine amidase [Pseudofulvimonas gallinarii]|jgi:N-acetylmuramoyl-L-alanine amidase|uniref:N-acetylmuramoyl-L-alanine amidase AmiC n=1 Tax=Pseudofulvimonas gallinarii TaxID=634155 RepID=A0A4R3LML5_9GAMM|nr:N-acetylmuramoyl-L-alanine amidase [Pseudofulvimonas gallinarii]TCT00739.1 N-acetylmuramoyl-L-alanine amidase [Pseudofulvimonas gallinarii]